MKIQKRVNNKWLGSPQKQWVRKDIMQQEDRTWKEVRRSCGIAERQRALVTK